MQEKQKEKQPPQGTNQPEKKEDTWPDDQTSRSYYYDDSHGYEVFQPESDSDNSEDED